MKMKKNKKGHQELRVPLEKSKTIGDVNLLDYSRVTWEVETLSPEGEALIYRCWDRPQRGK